MSDYPEHDKLSEAMQDDDSQVIGLFMEWFFTEFDVYPKGTVGDYMEAAESFREFASALAGSEIDIEYPMQVLSGERKFNEILARYYGIDYDELMREKDRMYESIRAA